MQGGEEGLVNVWVDVDAECHWIQKRDTLDTWAGIAENNKIREQRSRSFPERLRSRGVTGAWLDLLDFVRLAGCALSLRVLWS